MVDSFQLSVRHEMIRFKSCANVNLATQRDSEVVLELSLVSWVVVSGDMWAYP
jgi:hypothetical protein